MAKALLRRLSMTSTRAKLKKVLTTAAGQAKACPMMGWTWDVPSGYVKIAIENGHRNSGFSH